MSDPAGQRSSTPPAEIPEEIRDVLVDRWLPQLHSLKKERRPLQRLMIVLLLTPLAVLLVLVGVFLVEPSAFGWDDGAILTSLTLLSWPAVAYIGRIQSCNDALVGIELAVYMRNREQLLEQLSSLTCFSTFEGVIKDAIRIVSEF